MRATTIQRTLVRLGVVASLLGLLSRPAAAQDMTEQEKAAAKEHYEKGRAAYDQGAFDEAIKELKQAYMASRRSAILFNIGQTYKQLGDAALSLHFFQKFLAEADPADPNRSTAEAAVEELKAAGAGVAEQAAAETAAEEAAPPEPAVPDFRHVAVGEAPPRRAVDLKIKLGDESLQIRSLLYYRGTGQEDFTKVPFTSTDFGLVARIPRKAMSSGKSIQYYIESRKPNGDLYGSSGTAGQPNVIVIDPKAPAKDIAELNTPADEEPIRRPRRYEKVLTPAKWTTAGLAAVTLGAAAGFGAYGTRLATDIQNKARGSSTQTPDGSWSNPSQEYTADLEDLDQKGRQANRIALICGVAGGALAAISGVLFYLDWRREAATEEDVAFAPIVGPGIGGAAGVWRF